MNMSVSEVSMPSALVEILSDPRYFVFYVYHAIKQDFNFSYLVTSHTQGRVKAPASLPHGSGKTSRMIRFGAEFNSPDFPMNIYKKMRGDWEPSVEDWKRSLETLRYYPVDMIELMMPPEDETRKRYSQISWDDIQYTAPAKTGIHPIVDFIGRLQTVGRQNFAVMAGTAPNINRISKPLRENCHFEVIIPQRGYFECQKTNWFKNLYKPSEDLAHLRYLDEGPFLPLPEWVENRYRRWRDEQQKRVLTNEYVKQVANMIKRLSAKGGSSIPDGMSAEEFAEKLADLERRKMELKELRDEIKRINVFKPKTNRSKMIEVPTNTDFYNTMKLCKIKVGGVEAHDLWRKLFFRTGIPEEETTQEQQT